MNLLGLSFAPLFIPIERRLQTLATFIWMGSFLCGAVIGASILLYLLCYTSYWWISLAYISWFVVDRNSCNKGGRTISWMRDLRVWTYFRDFFPVELVKTVELDPEKTYLFTSQPHGVMCAGAFVSFATNALSFSKLFNGLHSRLLVLEGQFWFPIYREFLISLGACSASKSSMTYLLENEKNSAIVLVTGGVLEAMENNKNVMRLVLNRRKGFIKLAIKHGVPLVPTFTFGENFIYDIINNPVGSLLRKIQEFSEKKFSFSPILFNGRGIFQYSYGIVPRRKKLTVVVGSPMDIPRDEDPSRELIEETHSKFVDSVQKLYNEYNPKYGDPKMSLVVS
uniref:Acyltransferase n=1 Tax=Lepeophtheirus salmonis TaxID=72036 RepID=A0A0K2V3N8_LEPSM